MAAMDTGIAIIGMACRYPDADTVDRLFVNSLAQRRSFRAIPETRISGGYFDETGRSPDRAYVRQAALIRGFRFDRERFRVSRSSYEATDLTHWLALTVAQETIAGIRFRQHTPFPDRDGVRVVVGNSLTGEFSRAGLLRLRWPYVRAVVARHARALYPDRDDAALAAVLAEMEADYKRSFPVPNEDYLAGGLSNTIAGRICNHFNFRGGGYSVDGACASSLLAVADACTALSGGDADLVLAGGVDLSIDPFELTGFSRAGALARGEMRVYDERSEGFWPGEGCGFVALMRLEDALRTCEQIHGVIRGWGVSSDGQGGLTRPEAEGQAIALARCYDRARYSIRTVGYFEGHGTGTKVGDTAELRAILDMRSRDGVQGEPAAISSIKANIGHTKAAAGLAGLIRATKCVAHGILAPATSCQRPHPLLREQSQSLRTLDEPTPWPQTSWPRRASVSAMGFGGINTHVTVEQAPSDAGSVGVAMPEGTDFSKLRAVQDAELFVFAGFGARDITTTISLISEYAAKLSRAELTDLAAELCRRATRGAAYTWKAALVASSPDEFSQRLGILSTLVAELDGRPFALDPVNKVFVASGAVTGRIGLLFSGQAAPVRAEAGGGWAGLQGGRSAYDAALLQHYASREGTGFAQPAIATASVAGIRALDALGIEGDLAVGHSLGEVSALHWAGAFDYADLQRIARIRGQSMEADRRTQGAMLAISADRVAVSSLIEGRPGVHLANFNAPRQTVVGGGRAEIEALATHLRQAGVVATLLRLGQAFHTPAMSGVAQVVAEAAAQTVSSPLCRQVISTVTGKALPPDLNLADHLKGQLVAPVDFMAAVDAAAKQVDLFIECGPGDLFATLAGTISPVPALSLDVAGESVAPFLAAAGAAYVLGRAPGIQNLFAHRFFRARFWGWKDNFFQNPCELIPPDESGLVSALADETSPSETQPAQSASVDGGGLDTLRHLVAEITGLPVWTLQGSSRLLSDLHLNSITVGDILIRYAAACGVRAVVDPTEFVNASLDEVAALSERRDQGDMPSGVGTAAMPPGIDQWIRFFGVEDAEGGPPPPARPRQPGAWQTVGPDHQATRALAARLTQGAFGAGILAWIDAPASTGGAAALLAATQSSLAAAEAGQYSDFFLVIVQTAPGGGGFAKSFHKENPHIAVLVVTLPDGLGDDAAMDRLTDEIAGCGDGVTEVTLTASGARLVPRFAPLSLTDSGQDNPVGAGDVVLVTGGGYGIGAECAYHLARRTGCALVILGRSQPDASAELAANLSRLTQAGVRVSYQVADITSKEAVDAAIRTATSELGHGITGIVHAAGRNEPVTVAKLSEADMRRTIEPKVEGLHHILAATDTKALRLLVSFGSIIARIGLHGEADYALANEWLAQETARVAMENPQCRCRVIEYSVWSGVGMGERLGRVDVLAAQGITPVSVDRGLTAFLQAVETPSLPLRTIVCGRFGVGVPVTPPPGHRFMEQIRVYYPGVELVADCHVSLDSDPYLFDHMLDGDAVFPAVMATEAMAQAVELLMGQGVAAGGWSFTDVKFRKAIVLPGSGTVGPDAGRPALTLRLAALVQEDGKIRLAIRCSSSEFQINHFEAVCVPFATPRPMPAGVEAGDSAMLPEAPHQALYETVLFQRGRFRRIESYSRIETRRCSGMLAAHTGENWFSAISSPDFLLGDPGPRDGALHSVQACLPHKILIPARVEAIEVAGDAGTRTACRFFAREVEDHGTELIYDLILTDRDLVPVEIWHRVVYHMVADARTPIPGAITLAAPFMERLLAQRAPEAGLVLRVRPSGPGGDGWPALLHRPDGKPELAEGSRHYSAATDGLWRLEGTGAKPFGCDLQSISWRRDEDWLGLLGDAGIRLARVIASHVGEPLDCAATRVWTAREALKKAGSGWETPLTLDGNPVPHWVVLQAGGVTVYSTRIDPPGCRPSACVAVAV